MVWTRIAGAGVAAFLALVLVGCQQPAVNMDEMMKPPPRPVELDQLEPLVGTWQGTGEMKMVGTDKTMTAKDTHTAAWECERRILVESAEETMSDGNKSSSKVIWWWDPDIRKFRVWYFGSQGQMGTGTATYDAGSKTWHIQAKTTGMGGGQTSSGEGQFTLTDANTLKWTWTESMGQGLFAKKCMEGHGTSHRK